jgi:tetratricopeptide (TPR) repeat protein
MDAASLLDRMTARLELLEGGARDGRPDHASLRRAIDASWELLTPAERAALAHCAVFVGSFTVDGAEHVVDLSRLPGSTDVIAVVQSLRDKSLLRTIDDQGGQVRLSTYLSIREYARERFAELPAQERDAVLERHAEFYARLARRLQTEAEGPRGPFALRQLALERDQVMAVVERSLDAGQASPVALERGLDILAGLAVPYRKLGPLTRLLALLDRALEAPTIGATARLCRARALIARGSLARRVVNETGESEFITAARLARDEGDLRVEAIALRFVSFFELSRGRAKEAQAACERALECATSANDAGLCGWIRMSLSTIFRSQGRVRAAQSDSEEAIRLFRCAENHLGELVALVELALTHVDAGDVELARICIERAAPRITAFPNELPSLHVFLDFAQGYVEHAEGKLEDALAHYEEAVAHARRMGDLGYDVQSTIYAALVRFDLGMVHDARADLREALPAFERHNPPYASLFRAMLGAMEAELDRHGDARALIDAAERELDGRGEADPLVATVRMCRGVLEVAESREAAARGDVALAKHLRELARARLEGVDPPSGSADAAGFLEPRPRGWELCFATRQLENALSRSERGKPAPAEARAVLQIAGDGRWFIPPNGTRIACARRPIMQRMIIALGRARLNRPGAPLSCGELVDAGWPGYKMPEDVARNRVRVMMSRIRELGLRRWLEGTEAGYALDPALAVRFAVDS